ncbi:MAG: hypothetical protein S4CHLAM102_12650 [Chlamydiia bacterium]|nr:hypothetical protein [Chlamydiia bacterium]
MKKDAYPLAQLEQIKQKRLEEAEKVLAEKKEALKKEEEALVQAEKKRDEVKAHKQEKIDQYLESLDKGTTSDKILEMETYIKKVVEEKLEAENKKVEKQQEKVKEAEKAVEEARKDHFKKSQELEKIDMHKDEWKKEQKKHEARESEKETDEIGSSMHVRKKVAHPFQKKREK